MPKEYSLKTAYHLRTSEDISEFYGGWAEGYEDEVAGAGYITPQRCAEALAAHVGDRDRPMMDLGCGTGLSGLALKAAGFTCIDGYDLSEEMLTRADGKGVYRDTQIADLSKPLDIETGAYANAAAIGCLSPEYLPVTVLDEILKKLPKGGCLVFSLNDHAAGDGTMVGRVNCLVDCGFAQLLHREYGEHLPGIGLKSTVFVLQRR